MGNQASLHRKDRIGAVLYSELRKKYDPDGTAVDGPPFRQLVSHWRNAARHSQQIQASDLRLPGSVSVEATGRQSSSSDSGHCEGDGPSTDWASSACAGLSQDAVSEVRDGDRLKGVDLLGIVSSCTREASKTPQSDCNSVKKPEHSCSLVDHCVACLASISATQSSGLEKEDTTSLKCSERWSDASGDEEGETPSTIDPFDGDCAFGEAKPLSATGDYHPLVDLLPGKAVSHLVESALEDRFSRLQSELDSVYAEARDIELCISKLSRRLPPTDVGRLQRAQSNVEADSEYGSPQESSRALSVLRRYTVASASKGVSTRTSAPGALIAWSDDSCRLAGDTDRSRNETEGKGSAATHLHRLEGRHPEWSDDTYVDEACPIMAYASRQHADSTTGCHQDVLLKGYQNIVEDYGLECLYAVRADHYGAIRSCLAGALLRGLPVLDHLQPLEQCVKGLRECFDNHECLCTWGHAKDAKPKDDVITMLERDLQVLYDQCYQAVVCPAEVREYVVRCLMNDTTRDRASLEAIKALIMLRACEFYRSMAGATEAVPDYAQLLFTRDSSLDPGAFFTNHLNGVGIAHCLEQELMPLLADTLGMRLQIFWPSRFDHADFVVNVNTDIASPPEACQNNVVRLVAEDNMRYGVLVP